jgi:hypothetical protein
MAGLIIPFILFTIRVPPASTAPVLPADIKASPFPSLRSPSPTTRDESFFFLSASVGDSSLVITWAASTISKPSKGVPCSFNTSSIRSLIPTRVMLQPYSSAAMTAPFTTSFGALSPPIASIIILT